MSEIVDKIMMRMVKIFLKREKNWKPSRNSSEFYQKITKKPEIVSTGWIDCHSVYQMIKKQEYGEHLGHFPNEKYQ